MFIKIELINHNIIHESLSLSFNSLDGHHLMSHFLSSLLLCTAFFPSYKVFHHLSKKVSQSSCSLEFSV